jgi:hypothetical protein
MQTLTATHTHHKILFSNLLLSNSLPPQRWRLKRGDCIRIEYAIIPKRECKEKFEKRATGKVCLPSVPVISLLQSNLLRRSW